MNLGLTPYHREIKMLSCLHNLQSCAFILEGSLIASLTNSWALKSYYLSATLYNIRPRFSKKTDYTVIVFDERKLYLLYLLPSKYVGLSVVINKDLQ